MFDIRGTWHDWSTPTFMWPRVAAELERLAGLREGPYPKEGAIDLAYSVAIRLRWTIKIMGPEAECVLARIGE